MKYSIVIPTYNHCEDLLVPCVNSILTHSRMTDVELIISANGCTDSTQEYLTQLQHQFGEIGMQDHFKYVWHDSALGYSKACNQGIQASTTDLIVLLNNDTILLPQSHNFWLDALATPFTQSDQTGISCVVKSWSDPAAHDFAIFFCVMIHRKVFDRIGLLNEAYGKGGGEDTEFSIECERAGFKVTECLPKTWSHTAHTFTGQFPIYHKGEGTVHDVNLVPDWTQVFDHNCCQLAEKYNPAWLTTKSAAVSCENISQVAHQFEWLKHQSPEAPELFAEVIERNTYKIQPHHVKHKVVIDVGANQGMFSIMAAALGAKQVWACEPITSTHKLLQSNVRRSGLSGRVQCVQAAVLGRPQSHTHMNVHVDSGKNSLYDVGDHQQQVPVTTLEACLSSCAHDQVFLKLDCEGAEYDILLDSPNHVFDKVMDVAIEIHGDTHPVHKGLHLIHNRLTQLGFTCVNRQPYGIWWYDAQGTPVRWEPLNMSIELWSKT